MSSKGSKGGKGEARTGKSAFSEPGKVSVTVVECRGLKAMDSNGKSDPFAVVKFNKDSKTKEHTEVVKKTLNPVWNETFEFRSDEPLTDRLSVTVWDYDRFTSNDFEGHMSVPVVACAGNDGNVLDQWFPLLDKKKESKAKSKTERGQVHLVLKFIPKGDASSLKHVVKDAKTGNEQVEVRETAELRNKRWEIEYESLSLGKELGRGAFGVVFRGKWRLQDVAVKQLHQQKMTEDQLVEFRDECNLMMNLRPHRNVVPLLGVCTDPRNPFCLVIDFVEGGTLESLIKSPYIISWRLAHDIAKGICAGVYHLHQERILHRDLAARNILLRANYEPLIADFGLSKKVQPLSGINAKDMKEVKTQEAQSLRGPYKWMAPESLGNNEFSIKSDTWSYGVTLWELIDRHEPFPHLDIYEAAHRIVHEHMRLPIPPNTPSKFVNLLTWCWRSNPDDRPDFIQIANALADIELVVDTY